MSSAVGPVSLSQRHLKSALIRHQLLKLADSVILLLAYFVNNLTYGPIAPAKKWVILNINDFNLRTTVLPIIE